MLKKKGYYINLARSGDRRSHMEAGLRAQGLDWIGRSEAVDATRIPIPAGCAIPPPVYACFLSHANIIKAAPQDEYTFIFEDDVEFSPDFARLVDDDLLGRMAEFDVVFLDCQPECSASTTAALLGCLRNRLTEPGRLDEPTHERRVHGVDFYDGRAVYRWGLAAYVVTPRGRRSLPPVIDECLGRGPPGHLDILFQHAMHDGRVRGAVVAPFLVSPLAEDILPSTVDARAQDQWNLHFANCLRRSFFAGRVQDGRQNLAVDKTGRQAQRVSELVEAALDLHSRESVVIRV